MDAHWLMSRYGLGAGSLANKYPATFTFKYFDPEFRVNLNNPKDQFIHMNGLSAKSWMMNLSRINFR
jgi:hypothetical protein